MCVTCVTPFSVATRLTRGTVRDSTRGSDHGGELQMGHVHLATLPTKRPWREVVALLDGNAADEDVIRASAIAAEVALSGAARDPVLVAAVHLLTMVPQAARSGSFAEHLAHPPRL